MSFQSVLTLLGGLAFFLFGMRTMGEGLERAAGPKLKHFLAMMTRNRFIALLTGIAVTAIIQSSGATTVMVVGFVNAQLLTLAQSVGVIMGANIGTTVTSLLLSIKFDPGPVFAFIGIMMMMLFDKKETIKQAGVVCMGLGVLFIGMDLMSSSTEPLKEWPVFLNLMQGVRNPIVGMLIGIVVTALLQSSSVSVGIVQVLAAGGLVGMQGALYLLLGAKIGACTPSLISMANSHTAAKRTAMIHLIFNLHSAVIFLILSAFLPLTEWAEMLVPGNPKLCVSMMHISISIISTIILFPFGDWLVKLACLIVPGKEEETTQLKLMYYDERLLKTPSLAADQLYREVCRMGRETHDHLILAIDALSTLDLSQEQKIIEHEDLADFLEEAITEGLVAVMPLELSEHESKRIANLFHVVTDIERISDHAMNILNLAHERIDRKAKMSEKATQELEELFVFTMQVLDAALEGLEEWGIPDSIMAALQQAEQTVDDMTESLRKKHIDRLKEQKCTPKSGVIFLETINCLERVADHAMNIASCAREESLHTHNPV